MEPQARFPTGSGEKGPGKDRLFEPAPPPPRFRTRAHGRFRLVADLPLKAQEEPEGPPPTACRVEPTTVHCKAEEGKCPIFRDIGLQEKGTGKMTFRTSFLSLQLEGEHRLPIPGAQLPSGASPPSRAGSGKTRETWVEGWGEAGPPGDQGQSPGLTFGHSIFPLSKGSLVSPLPTLRRGEQVGEGGLETSIQPQRGGWLISFQK